MRSVIQFQVLLFMRGYSDSKHPPAPTTKLNWTRPICLIIVLGSISGWKGWDGVRKLIKRIQLTDRDRGGSCGIVSITGGGSKAQVRYQVTVKIECDTTTLATGLIPYIPSVSAGSFHQTAL